ncbi:MAG: lipid-transfer protein [Chloroflexi bacterium]|nr:MAG: lipid-transfer protein [Chloroflexota bacterium]
MTIRNQAAIVGIGRTEFSKNSGRSTLRMALETILDALDDAGLRPSDVDGVVKMSANRDIDEVELARALGLQNLRFFAEVPYGGGSGCGTVGVAASAVATEMAEVVVTFRSLNERSERRFGESSVGGGVGGWNAYYAPHGLVTPAQWMAIFGRRYLHEFDHDTDAFGMVTVLARKHAATNPHAMMYQRPITIEDHRKAEWIAEPLRLLDCCLDTDGACAAIVTSAARAKTCKSTPAYVTAATQGTGSRPEVMTAWQRDSIAHLEETDSAARELYRIAGMNPEDIDVLLVYDHFTPMVLMTIESYGFAARGQAPSRYREGYFELDGRVPLNPHGGHLGEGYIHGFNHIHEAVSQLRGNAANQVAGSPKTALVSSAGGVPTSSLILSLEAR